MPPLSMLIKPASGSCNVRCRYCFYSDVMDNRQVASYGVMDEATQEQVVCKALEDASGSCSFAFQGGEPTLAGLDYYHRLIELVERHNHKDLDIHYAIQTNGYVLDDEWAAFLAHNKFLVGLSLDGVKDVHDRYRLDPQGKGTFARAMRSAQLLTKNGVEFNILTVVTAWTAKNIHKIYGFYKRNGFRFQQYIPCLDPLEEERGQREYSLTPERYLQFLKTLFDLWYRDLKRGDYYSIRYFDNLVLLLRGYPPESCNMTGRCTLQMVVEADGEVYPCDFYVLDRYKLGNLNRVELEDVRRREKEIGFVDRSLQRPPECAACRWREICRGGCRRDREDDGNGSNYFCSAYREFFDYAFDRLQEIAHNPHSGSAGWK